MLLHGKLIAEISCSRRTIHSNTPAELIRREKYLECGTSRIGVIKRRRPCSRVSSSISLLPVFDTAFLIANQIQTPMHYIGTIFSVGEWSRAVSLRRSRRNYWYDAKINSDAFVSVLINSTASINVVIFDKILQILKCILYIITYIYIYIFKERKENLPDLANFYSWQEVAV